MSAAQPLLDPDFLHRLERLSLVARRLFAGQMKGERRSARRGASIEFADYREYCLGDDPRYVDWNSYARLDRLFLKLFVEEEDLQIHLLLDGSQSMAFGEPAKFEYARRLAAALGYVGLVNHDRVGAAIIGDTVRESLAPASGRAHVFRLFAFLQAAAPAGGTSLAASLRAYTQRHRRPGIALLISDFMDNGWEEGLKVLLAGRFQVAALQVLDTAEVEPQRVGDLKLVDSETGEEREISVTPRLLAEYRRAVEGFCAGVEAACRRCGAGYLRTTTALPVEDIVLRWLRSTGLVR